MTWEKPISLTIKRRTFEGKTNPKANNNSLTSKYMPSYKYWSEITYENGQKITNCHRTKREAETAYADRIRKAGQPM
jgi:hypothetical protein